MRNTNALCGPEVISKIGIFEKKATLKDITNFRLVDQVAKRLTQQRVKVNSNLTVREPRFLLNQFDITKAKGKKNMASMLIAETCNLSNWSSIDSIKSTIIKFKGSVFLQNTTYRDKKSHISLIPFQQSGCNKVGRFNNKDQGDIYDCPISQYGFARLILPSRLQ